MVARQEGTSTPLYAPVDILTVQGISMSVEQYSALIQIMPQVEELLSSKGEKLPRPDFSGATQVDGDEDDDDEEEKERDAKANIDATSDEDD